MSLRTTLATTPSPSSKRSAVPTSSAVNADMESPIGWPSPGGSPGELGVGVDVFDHVVRRTNDVFYKQGFHGIDWPQMSKDYRRFLPHIGNGYEFSELFSEMLGELNVSHCGSSFGGSSPNADATASLGVFPDFNYKGIGIKIDEVITGGPLDKAGFNVAAGTIIVAIDGDTISAEKDYAQFLNRKTGKNVLLTLNENGKTRELVIKPISLGEENQLLYKRWVKKNADEVTKMSNGALGYIVYIPGMNDGAYRTALEEAMGKYAGRKAMAIPATMAAATLWLTLPCG